MFDENLSDDATFEDNSTSIYEIMITTEMYSYYQVFPKVVMPEFAVFYATNHMTCELKLELQVILGIPIKFEDLAEDQLNLLIKKEEANDFIFQ